MIEKVVSLIKEWWINLRLNYLLKERKIICSCGSEMGKLSAIWSISTDTITRWWLCPNCYNLVVNRITVSENEWETIDDEKAKEETLQVAGIFPWAS